MLEEARADREASVRSGSRRVKRERSAGRVSTRPLQRRRFAEAKEGEKVTIVLDGDDEEPAESEENELFVS